MKPTLYTDDANAAYFEKQFNVTILNRESLLMLIKYKKGDYLAMYCNDKNEQEGLAPIAEEIAQKGVVVLLYYHFGNEL